VARRKHRVRVAGEDGEDRRSMRLMRLAEQLARESEAARTGTNLKRSLRDM